MEFSLIKYLGFSEFDRAVLFVINKGFILPRCSKRKNFTRKKSKSLNKGIVCCTTWKKCLWASRKRMEEGLVVMMESGLMRDEDELATLLLNPNVVE